MQKKPDSSNKIFIGRDYCYSMVTQFYFHKHVGRSVKSCSVKCFVFSIGEELFGSLALRLCMYIFHLEQKYWWDMSS